MSSPEFDKFAGSYEDLLQDPIRSRFTAGKSIVFHIRKREVILRYLRARNQDPSRMKYLDFGCGQGELLGLLGDSFAEACGCDPSPEMMARINGPQTRVQSDPLLIPYEDKRFDFVTAVCVYHHIPVKDRPLLTKEVFRVLRPGGTFCIIEHNPLNPATRVIVSRTPVDADAILLHAGATRSLMQNAGLQLRKTEFFLYLPEDLYKGFSGLEALLRGVPLGGQYAVFGERQ